MPGDHAIANSRPGGFGPDIKLFEGGRVPQLIDRYPAGDLIHVGDYGEPAPGGDFGRAGLADTRGPAGH